MTKSWKKLTFNWWRFRFVTKVDANLLWPKGIKRVPFNRDSGLPIKYYRRIYKTRLYWRVYPND